jgi:hypothetical protein
MPLTSFSFGAKELSRSGVAEAVGLGGYVIVAIMPW